MNEQVLSGILRRVEEAQTLRKAGKVLPSFVRDELRRVNRKACGCPSDEQIAGWVEGRLPGLLWPRVFWHIHVKRCPLCRRDVAELRGLLIAVGELQPPWWHRFAARLSAFSGRSEAPSTSNVGIGVAAGRFLRLAITAALLLLSPVSFYFGRITVPVRVAQVESGPEKSVSGLSSDDLLKWLAQPVPTDAQSLRRAAAVFEKRLQDSSSDAWWLRLRLVQFYARLQALATSKQEAEEYSRLVAEHRSLLPEALRALDPERIQYGNSKF